MLVRMISKKEKIKKASVSFPHPSKSPSIHPYPKFQIHQIRFSQSVGQVGQLAGYPYTLPYLVDTYYSGTKHLPYLIYIHTLTWRV